MRWNITILLTSYPSWHPENINCLGLHKYEWIVLNTCHSNYFSRCTQSPRLHCLNLLVNMQSVFKRAAVLNLPLQDVLEVPALRHSAPSFWSARFRNWFCHEMYPHVDTWTLSWEYLKTKLKEREAYSGLVMCVSSRSWALKHL